MFVDQSYSDENYSMNQLTSDGNIPKNTKEKVRKLTTIYCPKFEKKEDKIRLIFFGINRVFLRSILVQLLFFK